MAGRGHSRRAINGVERSQRRQEPHSIGGAQFDGLWFFLTNVWTEGRTSFRENSSLSIYVRGNNIDRMGHLGLQMIFMTTYILS